jgi:hypothetical protein
MTADLTPDALAERIKHERELREASALALEKALTIQAEEYERRLHELNEAHKQAAADREDFLARTEYLAERKAIELRLQSVERLVWLACGAVLLLQLVLRFIL